MKFGDNRRDIQTGDVSKHKAGEEMTLDRVVVDSLRIVKAVRSHLDEDLD